MHKKTGKCLTCMYAFISQIGEGDVTTGNMTAANDLQLAPPSQPLSQATGTDKVFFCIFVHNFLDTDQEKFHVKKLK